jgi:hypothetical protein
MADPEPAHSARSDSPSNQQSSGLGTPMLRHGFEQPDDVRPSFRIVSIEQNRIRCPLVANWLEFRIIEDDVSIVPDSKLGANLQENPCSGRLSVHDWSPSRMVWAK